MKPDTGSADLRQLGQAASSMLENQRQFGEEALRILGAGLGTLLRSALDQVASHKTASCCDIPEPCWMPKRLGEYSCRLCPGSSGSMRFAITNEDMRPRTVTALASGPAAGQVSFSPGSLHLGPKERGTLTASFALPGDTNDGESREAILWLRGCRDYYVRWNVFAGSSPQACCHQVAVSDGPDHVLHWYDHFYCPRECQRPNRG